MQHPATPKKLTSTDRMRALAARRKAGIVLPCCSACGRKCTSAESIQARLCATCRRKTPEGRKRAIDNAYKSINRQKKILSLPIKLTSDSITWMDAEKTQPDVGKEVLCETLRGAWCMGFFMPYEGWLDSLDKSSIKVWRWAAITINTTPDESNK